MNDKNLINIAAWLVLEAFDDEHHTDKHCEKLRSLGVDIRKLHDKNQKEIEQLQQKLSECISALEFYADEKNHKPSDTYHWSDPLLSMSPVFNDNGNKARETLRGLRDE